MTDEIAFMREDEYPHFFEQFSDCFFRIREILKRYMDMEEYYYDVVALWIIGTYFHGSFSTYPYLFINGEKGSGKTRLLQLVSVLSRGGILTSTPTEAVMFRLPNIRPTTLCIDEAENIGNEDKVNLRLLLNAAYKKGMVIPRMGRKDKDGNYQLDEFRVFTPISLANIYGLDAVLEDRCITLILEKSWNRRIVNRMGNYERDKEIAEVREELEKLSVEVYILTTLGGIVDYTSDQLVQMFDTPSVKENYTNYTNYPWELIMEASIDGRDLELWYPLLVLSGIIGRDNFQIIAKTASWFGKQKKEYDVVENRDIEFMVFMNSRLDGTSSSEYTPVSDLVKDYRANVDERAKWFTSRWVGHSVKRLNLAIAKRRIASGMEYVFDRDKISRRLERMGIIKPPENLNSCYKCSSTTVIPIKDSITGRQIWACREHSLPEA